MDDYRYDQLALQINELVERLEKQPDSQLKEDTFKLLQLFDAFHREALVRLLKLIQTRSSGVTAQIKKDFVIQTLLMAYGFVAPEEIPEPTVNDGTFIPVDQIKFGYSRKPKQPRPIWIPIGKLSDLPAGELKSAKTDEGEVLLYRINDEIFALQYACLDSILPLQSGSVEGYILTCPWHGCKYDLRTGKIQNDSGLKLQNYPVQINAAGKILVGFNITEPIN